ADLEGDRALPIPKTEHPIPKTPRRYNLPSPGVVPKWLREGSAKPSFSSSNLLGASPRLNSLVMAARENPEPQLTVVAGLGLVAPPPIHIQAPTFEGSLATLLRCVRDNKVKLLDVPLLPVCEAYFEYLVQTNLADLDEAAAALLALAYLLER